MSDANPLSFHTPKLSLPGVGDAGGGPSVHARDGYAGFGFTIAQIDAILDAEAWLEGGDSLPGPDSQLEVAPPPALSESDINSLMQQFALLSVKLAREMKLQQTLQRQGDKIKQVQLHQAAADEMKTAARQTQAGANASASAEMAQAGASVIGTAQQARYNKTSNAALQKANEHATTDAKLRANPNPAAEANARQEIAGLERGIAGHRDDIAANNEDLAGLHRIRDFGERREIASLNRRHEQRIQDKQEQIASHKKAIPDEVQAMQRAANGEFEIHRAAANAWNGITQIFSGWAHAAPQYAASSNQLDAGLSNANAETDKALAEKKEATVAYADAVAGTVGTMLQQVLQFMDKSNDIRDQTARLISSNVVA